MQTMPIMTNSIGITVKSVDKSETLLNFVSVSSFMLSSFSNHAIGSKTSDTFL